MHATSDVPVVAPATSLEPDPEFGKGPYPWFALQVRSRHEKNIATLMHGKGYEPFLPLYKGRRRWSDRFKEMELPLFPGYLFCRFDVQNRLPVLTTPGVFLVVGRARTPVPVDDSEIAAIQKIVASGLEGKPWPFLQVGARVRIECGALCGLEGILLDFKGRHRLVVSVTLLQRSVAVEIDGAWLSPVHNGCHPAVASRPLSTPMASLDREYSALQNTVGRNTGLQEL
jgi:transcription antitermination factor NusG